MTCKMYFLLILTTLVINSVQSNDYIINNYKCKVADYKAFNEETLPLHMKHEYEPCTNLTLLSYLKRINNTVSLRIRKNAIKQYTDDEKGFFCCYSYVRRSSYDPDEPDVGVSYTDCHTVEEYKVVLKESIVKIKCYDSVSLLYENVHTAILPQSTWKTARIPNHLNVLFIVIDSMSNQHLRRTMPETYNFVKQNNFFEFIGYNKVALNTFPNCMAFLTGYNPSQVKRYCDPTKLDHLDNCSMIWKDYERAGYVTGYAEDWTSISTFNYERKGFTNPPTTFYWKPYMEASESCGINLVDGMPFCAGPESTPERIFNLVHDFTNLAKEIPTFGIFWLNTFSHGYVNAPTRMDLKMVKFFSNLKRNGVFNNTAVIFLSDHGLRFGEICKTSAGYMEERHPFHFISLPSWFQNKWPEQFNNMKENQKKLTSTFDLHMTLQDILVLTGVNHRIKQSEACPKCKSLFSKIPNHRSCSDAGIDDVWCGCFGYLKTIDSNNDLVKNNLHLVNRETQTNTLVNSRITEMVNNKRILLLDFKADNFSYVSIIQIKKDNDFGKLLTTSTYLN